MQQRSLDEESKVKSSRTGDQVSSNGQLNKQQNCKFNGHLIGQPASAKPQLNGQATKEPAQLNGKTQAPASGQPNGKENLTNGLAKAQLNGQINGQAGSKPASNGEQPANGQANGQANGVVNEIDLELPEELPKQEPELMDTSEPPADSLEEAYEIETDQNNNIVLIKCKVPAVPAEPVDKAVIEINNNSVPQCKMAGSQPSTASSQPSAKPKQAEQPDGSAAKESQALNASTDSKSETKVNGEEKAPVKPNLTSLQQASSSSSNSTTASSTTSNSSTNTAQIAKSNLATCSTGNSVSNSVSSPVNKSSSDKGTVISKLRKIAADSVHNAIKFKKVDEQTAITTVANGVPKEKKVLKCANNGNEPTGAENSVKIGRLHLADQLAKSRNQAEELSSSPNENDQTLAQSPPAQLQQQTKKTSASTNSPSNGKLKIPWNDKIDSWWHDLVSQVDDECEPVWIDAEHPLFILYTRWAFE